MKGGRKRCQSRLKFGTSLLRTASTSRGHVAVTRGKAPVNILRRVSGREGKGGEERMVVVVAGAHEALWCHRNVSLCQVQSSLAVIF